MAKAKPPKTVNPGLPEVDEGSPNHLRRAQISVAQYSGPLPPASELERYEEVCPGAAKVILEAFQAETNHRHEMDKKYFDLDKRLVCGTHSRGLLGLWLGFTIAMTVLFLAGWLVYLGNVAAGVTIATIDLASLAGVFVYGQKLQAQDSPPTKE